MESKAPNLQRLLAACGRPLELGDAAGDKDGSMGGAPRRWSLGPPQGLTCLEQVSGSPTSAVPVAQPCIRSQSRASRLHHLQPPLDAARALNQVHQKPRL